jgi:hypothetical protein
VKQFAFIVLLCLGCSCSTVNTVSHGIPNLAQVEPGVWRGGQPTDEGWKYLSEQGVILDIKLNPADEGSDATAEKYGITVLDDPITTAEQTVGKPTRDQIVFAVMPIGPGTFIHCTHGQDRTGIVIGAYRVMVEGWTKDAAWKEMVAHGFHPALLGLSRSWNEDVP